MPELSLKTAIGSYPHTKPLKDGRVTSPRVALDHVEFTPANRAFRPMANEQAFDVSELAIVTYFVARTMNKPIVLLPVVLMCQPELSLVVCQPDSPLHTPDDLQGKTIAVRSYTQTTATWVRGILKEEYGLDLGRLKWKTLEGSHVDGFQDPPNAERMPADTNLFDLLKEGQADAAIIAWEARETPGIRQFFDDPLGMENAWAKRRGLMPVNHLLSAKRELLEAHPWVTDELVSMFKAGRDAGAGEAQPEGQSAGPWGLEANRAALETMARFAFEQGIAPKQFSVDELFAL
ncbi:MAG TPA: ABC transporter substrate-binding protein [Chloroflexota bacterium]|nr:ABC transporter substrate-binding protein [Chloroflexota bacterium]